MSKKSRKRKKRIRKILIGACGVLLLALLVLLTVLLIRLFSCGAKEASVDLSAASAVPTAAATLLPTDPPAATPTPYVTPVPKITDAWYAERNEALTQHVRAFSGLTDEEAIQKRVEGMAIDPDQKMVAFTFDDGPRDELTDGVLDVCEQYNVRVTFFIKGAYIAGHEPQLKRMLALGCEIGNHSWSHPQLTDLSSAGIASQLSSTDNAVKNITGKKPALCRAPYGAVNDTVLSVMNRPNILWSVDTLDWKYRDTGRLIGYVRDNKRDGAVILMHDIHAESVEAALKLIPKLRKKGFELVTVSELATLKSKKLENGLSYRSLK